MDASTGPPEAAAARARVRGRLAALSLSYSESEAVSAATAAEAFSAASALSYAAVGAGTLGDRVAFSAADGAGYRNELTGTFHPDVRAHLQFDNGPDFPADGAAVEQEIKDRLDDGYSVLTVVDEVPAAAAEGWSGIAYIAVPGAEDGDPGNDAAEMIDPVIEFESIVVIDGDTVRHGSVSTGAPAAEADRPELRSLAADTFTGEMSRTDVDLSVPNDSLPVGLPLTITHTAGGESRQVLRNEYGGLLDFGEYGQITDT